MKNICPKCGGREFDINAIVSTTALVEFSGDDEDGHHEVHDENQHGLEWDEDSSAECRHCGHTAPLGQMVAS